MSIWTVSMAGRAAETAGRVFSRSWSVSGSRRLACGLLRGMGPWFGGSRLLSTDRSRLTLLSTQGGLVPGGSPPAAAGETRAVSVLTRLFHFLHALLGHSWLGRGLRVLGASWDGSRLAGGRWLVPAGGGLIGTTGAWAVGALRGGEWLTVLAAGLLLLAGLGLAGLAAFPSAARASLCGRLAQKVGFLGTSSGVMSGESARGLGVSAAAALGAAALMAYVTSRNGAGALLMWALVALAVGGVFLLYRPEALLPLLAAFPWVDWAVRRVLGPGLGGYWDEALLLGALLAVLFSAVVLGRSSLRSVPALLPLVVGVVLAAASLVVNQVPDNVAQFALRITFQPFLFYLAAAWCPKERRWVKAAVTVFLAGCVLMALHGLYQYVSGAPMPAGWVDTHEDIGTRAYSIVENPNGLGNYLLLGTLLSAALALSHIRRRWRVTAAGVTVVLLAALAVTFSRGSYFGLAAGVAAMVLLAFRHWIGRLAVLTVAGLIVMPQKFIDRVLFGFSSYYLTLSQANGRLYVWKIALHRLADHPWWGVGLGTLGGTSAVTAGYSRLWIDNFYLQLLAEGGLPLLLVFLWMLTRDAKGIVAAWRAQKDPFFRSVGAGAFGAFVAVTVAAVFTSSWETLAVGAGFWFLAGLASSLPCADEPAAELPLARDLRPVSAVSLRLRADTAGGSM